MSGFNSNFNDIQKQISFANLTDKQIKELMSILQTKRSDKSKLTKEEKIFFQYCRERRSYSVNQDLDSLTFMGYERENGEVGIRNDIWIVNTVGCVNKTAQRLSEKTGAKYLPHPFGCSQLGDDQTITQKILKGMVNHPNAGGVLVVGLGCVQKGELSQVVDVLDYGDTVTKSGLSLLNGPGNDIVAVTNLMAAGVHLILFTTGRGTPLGSAVPTIKIATNHPLAIKKSNWIDFDASGMLCDVDPTNELMEYVIKVADGEKTKNEQNGYEEISIFKDGVTL